MMIEAQKNDVKLQQSVQLVRNGDLTDYSIEEDGGLYYKTRLYVPNVLELRKKLMYESHNTVFTMHPGHNKMYQNLKRYHWWQGMKKDIAGYVSKCLTCQQVKAEHQVSSGLLNPIAIPQWKWDNITMDFVSSFPLTQRKHDSIWVIVDRLTKFAHFLLVRLNHSMDRLAELYMKEIVRLHGIPFSIVFDCDPQFTSRFWKEPQSTLGTRLNFSTAFHPQTDGQFERVIQVLEDMLRGCVLDLPGSWDRYISLMEFAITTVFSPVLVWPPMKPCMEEKVELLYIGPN